MRIALLSGLLVVSLALLQAPASAQQPQSSAREAYEKGDYATALAMWRAAAEAGDAKAQVNLGRMYALGHGVEKNVAAALAWFRRAAAQGNAVAHHNIGVMLETGDPPDPKRAAEHYRIAAEDGWTPARTALGKLYQQGRGVPRDYAAAARWFEKAAEDNDSEAQYLLGTLYAAGRGVERDLGEMLRWTERAARQGHVKALFRMGWVYDRGVGVAPNPAAAARFYAVAAKKGNAPAQARLGEMYFRGAGIEQDRELGLALLTQAAAAGAASAQYLLGYAYHEGVGVARNPARGAAYYQRAAESGHPEARLRLGLAYLAGDGVAANAEKGFELLSLAAETGNARAEYQVGRARRDGLGTTRDAAEAARWFLKAARQGHREAQLALARLYRDGVGIARNDRAALRWLGEAARGGNAEAMADLAERYLAGHGVPRDPGRGVALLGEAAEKGLKSAEIRLADIYAEGTLVAPDPAKAAAMYRKLAEKGDPHSTAMLAAFRLEGKGGLARDPARAAELFRIAANLGSARAADMLGALHAEGRGVDKSYAEAARWYRFAAEKGDDAAHYALGGMYLSGLGVAWDPKAAERHYRAALAIREKHLGPAAPALAEPLLRLAELSQHLGKGADAISYYSRAARILQDDAARRDTYLEALSGLAAAYRDSGRLKEAEAAIGRALDSLGPAATETAAVLKLGLGELYEALGRDGRAAEVYGEALKAMGRGAGYRNALAARARVLARLGRDDEAEAGFVEALTLMEDEDAPGFAVHHARALGDYGRLLTRLGHFGEAAAAFEKAERLIDGMGLEVAPRGLAASLDFARAYRRLGKTDSAIAVLRRATRGHARRDRWRAGGAAADPWSERRLVRRAYRRYLRLLTRTPMSEARRAEAFEAAQGLRLLDLSPAMERLATRLSTGDDALGRLLDDRRRTIAGWRALERRLVGPEAGSGRVDPAVLRRGFRELQALERRLDRIEGALREDFPAIAALLAPAPVGIDEARRLLRRDEALIVTVVGRRETHVWVLTRDAAHYHRAALGAREAARIVAWLRDGMEPPEGVTKDGEGSYPVALAAELYRRLLGPAATMLDGVSHVFYVADGPLRDLPPSVLVVDLVDPPPDPWDAPDEEIHDWQLDPPPEPAAALARYRQVVWFADKYACSEIPSVTMLRALRGKPAASVAAVPPIDASKLDDLRLLSRVAEEAGRPATVAPATLSKSDPAMLTVPGTIAGQAGADRLAALAAAYFHAGARTLLVSRWSVAPEAAAALRRGMRARLKRDGGAEGPARRLQRSALDMLADETGPARFAHPMSWGGLTVIGDGRGRGD